MHATLKLNFLLFNVEVNITKLLMELKLFLKINFFLIPLFVAAYAGASYLFWMQTTADAERDLLDKARIMLETSRAMRIYTTDQIAPLLDRQRSEVDRADKVVDQFLSVHLPDVMTRAVAKLPTAREQQAVQAAAQDIVARAKQDRQAAPAKEFLPQSVPFYAATESFNYFRQKYPDFSYKEAALNPTNPRDRTSDWERDVVEMFHADPARKEFFGRRDTPLGPMLYASTPVRVEDKSCLACHGVPGEAPAELIRRYGGDNGFGWTTNDVVGAQIVSIPAKIAEDRAIREQKTMMLWLGAVFGGLWACVNLLLYVFFRPPTPAGADSSSPAVVSISG